jgi:acylglycerol lipase
MPHHEETLIAADGLKLFLQGWRPEGGCRAVMAVVHGICEHGGRYARLAADLNGRGYALYACDLRGHGRSEGDRCWIDSFDCFLDDVERFLGRVGEIEPATPVFLFGHSLGGLIVVQAALHRPLRVQGLILSSSAISVGGKVFPVLRHLAMFFSRVTPRLRVARMGSRFMSRDRAVVAAFKSDPLVYHGKFPVRTGAEILRAARQAQRRLGEIALPMLILHGTRDVVTDAGGSRRLHAQAAAADKTLRLYEGLYHEIFSEPEREQIVGDLLLWLDERTEKR